MNQELDLTQIVERIAPTATRLLSSAVAKGITFASIESLTGGAFGSAVTTIPGASQAYRGGLITYATDLKHTLGGVDADVLATHGAVSQQTAEQLAQQALRLTGADLAVSMTGVAGPDTQEGKPVGTVWIGVAGPHGAVAQLRQLDVADQLLQRTLIRQLTVLQALEILLLWVEAYGMPRPGDDTGG